MIEAAHAWEPAEEISKIAIPFAGIDFAYGSGRERAVSVVMHGKRSLHLRFSGTIALRFEDDCPGFNPLPKPLPMIRPGLTFPTLRIDHSSWLGQWGNLHMHRGLCHFALLSLDDLVQIIAMPIVAAHWE